MILQSIDYAWLTLHEDGDYHVDFTDTTEEEARRRRTITEELAGGRIGTASGFKVATASAFTREETR